MPFADGRGPVKYDEEATIGPSTNLRQLFDVVTVKQNLKRWLASPQQSKRACPPEAR